jgi:phospholipid N-methyltransferase
LTFIRQFVRDQYHTGAVLPSSRFMSRAMTRSLRYRPAADAPARALEVGPGTGVVTKELLRVLHDGDTLDIVEINPVFCRALERTLLAPARRTRPRLKTSLHCGGIEEAHLDGGYDYIICSVPFNNFPAAAVRRIFRRMLSLLAPEGELIYFEYAGIRMLKASVSRGAERRRLSGIEAFGRMPRQFVLRNVPPAYARRLVRRSQSE